MSGGLADAAVFVVENCSYKYDIAMGDFLQRFFLAFVPIFVAVDAFGLVPIYLGLTCGVEIKRRQRIVRQATITAMVVAVAFIFLGRAVFELMGIQVYDFMVAGGALLFLIAANDLLSSAINPERQVTDIGVVPIGMPLMVGPAVLTTILMVGNQQNYGLWPTLAATIVNIAIAGVVLSGAEVITRVIGEAGSKALSKVASLILAAIAVTMIRKGIIEAIAAAR
jgi:multiple antibiotic resistance protein